MIGARFVSLFAVLTTIATLAGGAMVVEALQDKPQVRSSVEVIIVTATVRDETGRLATGLPREAFEIYEDGAQVPVTQFTSERVPLGLGLLLDISDSMFGRRIKDAEGAVERFLLELLPATDAFFVMGFNHEPHLLFGWKTAPDGVHEALARLHPAGSTAIYDALYASLPFIENRPRERAAIVLITDGEDTASDMTLYDLRPALVRTDAFVYAIAIDTPATSAINKLNVGALNEITGQSGGRTEVVRSTEDLGPATANIADELNHQYVLGYSSPHAGDGKYHSIRVAVSREGYRVRARQGYVATRRTNR